MPAQEVYVVTDIEADGPIPGSYSMRSLGSVAVLADGTRWGSYTVNLDPLPHAKTDPETMEWWERRPGAWAACNENRQRPEEALPQYAAWLKALPGQIVFTAYPVAYDFMFTSWYLTEFAGECPFGWSGLDVKTLGMIYAGGNYMTSGKSVSEAIGRLENPHIALRDAELEAEFFIELLSRVRKGERLR